MSVGVALIRASGDRHDPASFGATFIVIMVCVVSPPDSGPPGTGLGAPEIFNAVNPSW